MGATADLHVLSRLFDPARLTVAREMRGLLKTELAERIGKTPAAVTMFEGGRTSPDPRTLGRIAMALGVPAAFLARRPEAPPLGVRLVGEQTLGAAGDVGQRVVDLVPCAIGEGLERSELGVAERLVEAGFEGREPGLRGPEFG